MKAVALIWIVCVAAGLAQEPGPPPNRRPPPPPPGAEGGRRPPPDLDPLERERRMQEWEEILDSLTPQERESVRRLPPPERLRAARGLVERHRKAMDEAFLESLPEAQRSEIQALPEAARKLRLLELKVDQQLERLLADAVDRQILDAAAAEAIRGTKGAKARAERAADLQKRIFLDVHHEDLERLPEPEREHLASLPPREFFRSPFANELKARRLLTDEGLIALRNGGRAAIQRLLRGIESGEVDADLAPHLREEGRQTIRTLPPPERQRLARQLQRMAFFRDLDPAGEAEEPDERDDPPPGPRHPRRPVLLPGELWQTLAPAERMAYLRMAPENQAQFAERRFPKWWATRRQGGGRQMTLRSLIERVQSLPPEERDRLLDLPAPEAIRQFLGPGERRGDDRRGEDRRGPPGEGRRGPPGEERRGPPGAGEERRGPPGPGEERRGPPRDGPSREGPPREGSPPPGQGRDHR